MFEKISRFLQDIGNDAPRGEARPDDARVAVVALCYQVMEADGVISDSERSRLRELIENQYDLHGAGLEELISAGEEAGNEAVDFYRFTSDVKRHLDEDQRARLRSEKVGFVFQNFQLIPTLSALENAMVPLELRQEQNVRARAVDQLGRVGLGDRLDHYPAQLSGGEQQRVAIARAFINRPTILFADEPTGNLDDDTSGRIQDLLFELNEEAATTLILVTHDLELARLTRRIIRLQGGRIASDDLVEDSTR